MSDESQIIPASSAARKRWILTIAAGVLFFGTMYVIGQSLATVPEGASLEELEGAVDRSETFLAALCFSIAAVALYAAVHYGRFAKQIAESQQYPPPGTEMPFNTRVRSGTESRPYTWYYRANAFFSAIVGSSSLWVAIRVLA